MPTAHALQAIHVIETRGISALSIHATGEGVEIEVADLDPLITPATAGRPHHGGRAITVDGVDVVDSAARFGAVNAYYAHELARLQAGGCARDQRTTQFCAEVVALHDRIEGALSAALGDPVMEDSSAYDRDGCPDLESLIRRAGEEHAELTMLRSSIERALDGREAVGSDLLARRVQSLYSESHEAYQHHARALGYPHGPDADGEPNPSAPYVADPHTLGTLAGEAADRIALLTEQRDAARAEVTARDARIADQLDKKRWTSAMIAGMTDTMMAIRADAAELRRLLHQLVIVACGAQDIGQTPEARRDIVVKAATRISEDRAAIEELCLTLAAEQGKPEGAPSSRWKWQRDRWEALDAQARVVAIAERGGRLQTREIDEGLTVWPISEHGNARAAMQAADAAQEKP